MGNIKFGFLKKLPVIIQVERAECSIACVAMIAAYYNLDCSLAAIRKAALISSGGGTLRQLMSAAENVGLTCRPVKLDMDELQYLKLPCVLHWNFNHFVVLKKVSKKSAIIHDPAQGELVLSHGEVSMSFTGVAVELWCDHAKK